MGAFVKLSEYLSSAGIGAITQLSLAIKAHHPDVISWSKGKRPVPIWRCLAIEQATNGAVTRKDLRPDDWERIWPELSEKEGV